MTTAPYPQDRQGAKWARVALGYSALLLLPPLLMLAVFATKFQGLRSAGAEDHAQLARHVAAGDGFTTSVIRPLSLVFKADLHSHPDLYNAPAHPLLLAAAYAILYPTDRVTAAVGAGLWVLSVWLTFWVARNWFGTRTGALAALFYGCNILGIEAALSGLAHPLTALALLLTAWAAAPPPREDVPGEPPDSPPAWRIVLAGAASAVTALSHYLMLLPVMALAGILVTSRRKKVSALLLLAAGFLVVAAPWMWRNARAAGSPFFSLYPYEILANTETYPGETVWRTLATPPHNIGWFILTHPGEILRKALTGLYYFRDESLRIADPVLAFLFVLALLDGAGARRWRRLVAAAALGIALGVAGACFLRAEPGPVLVWTPLLAIVGAVHVTHWSARLAERTAAGFMPALEKFDLFWRVPDPQASARRWVHAAATSAAAGAIGFPLFYFAWVARPSPEPLMRGRLEAVAHQLPPDAVVMTDQPAAVAWFADRRAAWLCQQERDLDAFERVCGPVDAVYVTSAIALIAERERGDWWVWVTSPRGVYRNDLVPVEPMPRGAVLRVRRKAP